MSRLWGITLAAALCAGCGDKGGPEKQGSARKGPARFPVEVEPVAAQDVEYAVNAVGSVEAFEQVQVTARVAGVVDAVRFEEGQVAKAGEVLVEIEPSRYRLGVRAARAAVEKARATQAEASASLQRRESVNQANPGLIRTEELETFRTRVSTGGAELAAAQVALEQAELNLKDAYVRAPMAGVLQSRAVQPGQYVQVGAVLGSLLRRDPLRLRFKVAEGEVSRLATGMPVRFTVRNDARAYAGRITYVADAAEETTRMVTVAAEVDPRGSEGLRPGAFAEVTVPVGALEQAAVIPQTAVRPSERGFLAFVVDPQGVAHEKVLTLGLRTPDGRVEVRDGLAPGDRVVVRGAEALRDGAPVKVESGRSEEPRGGDAGGPGGQR